MDNSNLFQEDIDWVLHCCKEKISCYPTAMLQDGQVYLEKLHLLKESKKSGGFSYLMPFWFKEPFSLSIEACRTIAMGNCFALLYFMSQDDIYDNNRNELLPLSNLFYLDFIAQYRSLFPSDSPFWSYFNTYITEWATSIQWERFLHLGQANPYKKEDLILLSRKAAPLKIPFAAVCLLADRESDIPSFAEAMDYDQIVYQMIDDWRDWKEDLQNKRYSYLLMQAMAFCNLTQATLMEEAHVRRAIFVGTVAEEIFEMALTYNQQSKNCIKHLNVPGLFAYYELEENICRGIMENIGTSRASMMQGGFGMLMNQLISSK